MITGNATESLGNLQSTESQVPSRSELDQADYFLRAIRGGRLDRSVVANAVCTAACTWRNLELWKRAVSVCGADSKAFVLETRRLEEAILTFGFSNVKPMQLPGFVSHCRYADLVAVLFRKYSRKTQVTWHVGSYSSLSK